MGEHGRCSSRRRAIARSILVFTFGFDESERNMPTSTISSTEQAEIAAVPARMVAAWAAHDAKAFADLFTQDGTLILPGVYKKGHEEIHEFMAAAYAGPYQGTRVIGSPIDVKPLADGAVALLTMGGVLAPGETELSDKA